MIDVENANDGELLDRMADLREAIAELANQEKDLKAEASMIEAEMLARMEQRGTDKLSNSRMTAIKSTTTMAKVINWDDVFDYIKKTGDFSLMQKRISDTVYREMLVMEQVPGIIPVDVTKVGFRKR